MTRRARRQRGYNLVALTMGVAVLNILVAAALPLWSTAIRRDKEEELISRGLQYAEAIRVFQKRHGRLPTKLSELLEVEPRSIRQLWTDPMTEKGRWALVIEGMGAPGQMPMPPTGLGGDPTSNQGPGEGVPGLDPPEEDEGEEGDGKGGTFGAPPAPLGPIKGVRSRSKEESVKVFCGKERYSEWLFTSDLLTSAVAQPGQPSPRLNATVIGRPFREGFGGGAGGCGGMMSGARGLPGGGMPGGGAAPPGGGFPVGGSPPSGGGKPPTGGPLPPTGTGPRGRG